MKILIAVDEGAESHDAVEFAKKVVPDAADVIVLNVARYDVTPVGALGSYEASMYASTPLVDERMAEEADRRAAETVHEVSEAFPGAEERVEHGDAGERICVVAGDEAVDLIVLGTHDRSRWSRLWFGSVSDHVVHHAPCPVLVVR